MQLRVQRGRSELWGDPFSIFTILKVLQSHKTLILFTRTVVNGALGWSILSFLNDYFRPIIIFNQILIRMILSGLSQVCIRTLNLRVSQVE